MTTAERVRDILAMFVGYIPVGVGVVLIVWGLFQEAWGTVSLGVGLIGVPGIRDSLKGVGGGGAKTSEVVGDQPAGG